MRAVEILNYDVIRYDATKNIFADAKRFISVEKSFELRLNGAHFKEIFCSPNHVEDLAVGILAQAEKIFSADDITRIEVSDSLIDVEIKADVQPTQINLSAKVKFVAKDILTCADKLLGELSTTHGKTNSVHSGALFNGKNLLLFREDIGRHNVFNKIFGAALREKIFLGDKMIIFSGRCSSEIILKLRRMNISVVVAKSVPTTYSINFAKKLGITLAGRMTADSFCIYSKPERIVLN